MSKECLVIHNPGCSKCGKTQSLLEAHGYQIKNVDYLHGELTNEILHKVLKALNARPKDIIRTKEKKFIELDLNLENDQDVIEAILKYPEILERPIVIIGTKAVIGRPPENILAII